MNLNLIFQGSHSTQTKIFDRTTESSVIPQRNHHLDTLPVRLYDCYEHNLYSGDKLVKSVSTCIPHGVWTVNGESTEWFISVLIYFTFRYSFGTFSATCVDFFFYFWLQCVHYGLNLVWIRCCGYRKCNWLKEKKNSLLCYCTLHRLC